MKINKIFIVFLILFLGVGCVSASEDFSSYNGTDMLSVDDTSLSTEGALSADDIISDEGALSADDIISDEGALSSEDSLSYEEILDDDDSPLNEYDLSDEEILKDDEPIFDFDNESYNSDYWDEIDYEYLREHYPELFYNSSYIFPWLDLSCGNASEIITSNITQYDFNDAYRVKVVDEEGKPVFTGKVDFYLNHKLVGTSFLDFSGIASLDLSSCINVSDTYDLVSIYSDENDSNSLIAHQNIYVKDLKMEDRDIQIYCENIKLYDLGETYRVKVVDKAGNPVTNGYVIFIVYDRVFYCNLSESGIASCALPLDLNFTGNLLVWSIYSDGNLYDLAIPEQISIGTRTFASLNTDSLGSLMFTRWNKYDFVYDDGKYVARIGGPSSTYYMNNETIYLVRELSGETYTVLESNISSTNGLNSIFSSDTTRYDVVVINLVCNKTYDLGEMGTTHYSDQEWDYIGRISYGQWIINGNGATIKGGHDINFLFIGSEANVNFFDTNITNFDHCFINHGNLMCKDCIFDNNEALKTDVKLWGSGAVVHNYNTIYFDHCYYLNNDAKFYAITVDHMGASILYAEPYSVNIFNGIYGKLYTDSFYCEPYSTTIIYDHCEVVSDLLCDSEFAVDSYVTTADYYSFYSGETWEVNVTNTQELTNVFWVLNTYINASEVIINMAPGTYNFDTSDYKNFRYYNWRKNAEDGVKDRYMLDVGLCPVTINGNGAVIHVGGNDNHDDYHFAFIGQYGSLTLNNVELQNFNTAIYVTGSVVANHSTFRDNVIDYRVYNGDVGGVFRSYGGSIVCHNCRFIDNGGDDDTDDFYAELSSYVELKNCSSPQGRMKDSYLKCTLEDKKNINLKGDSIFENAFEEGFEEIDFIAFNVSNDETYNAIFDYLKNHTVNSMLINFTGNYNFNMSSEFERSMSVIFQNNGYDVNFNKMEIKKSNSFNFINFNFNNVKIVNKGTVTFINCSIFNKDGGDYALKNEGSCTLISCSIFDNYCEDEIIWNTGSLTVLNSNFWNDTSDEDDGFKYGIIYNDGGSVKFMNSAIDSSDYDIYNFNSGNCAIADNNNRIYNLVFDKPWSNFKKGMIKGAFMLGTALFSYGAGTIIGIAVPTVAGFIGATVAGTAIGVGGGVFYSVLEGKAYHDYSNMWSNVLSFTMLGLSMGEIGFSFGSTLSNQLNQAMNQQPDVDVGDNPQGAQGGQGGQGAQGGQGGQGAQGGHISLNDGYQNSPFRDILDQGIEDMLFNLKPIQNVYPNVYGHYVDTYAIMASNPQITVMDMMNLYYAIYTANSAIQNLFNQNNQQLDSANQQANPVNNQVINPIQIVNTVNNIVLNQNENIPIAQHHYVNPFVGINMEAAALVHGYMDQINYLENFIRGNDRLSYLNEYLNLNTYYTAMNNISHTNRVLTLLYNFAVLSENIEYAGQSFLTNELVVNQRFYRRTIGTMGTSRIINNLFNPRSGALEAYESIYQAQVDAFNERLNQTGIREYFESNQSYSLRTVLDTNMVRLINDINPRINSDSRYYEEYVGVRETYYANFIRSNRGNIDLLWNLLNRLKKINESQEVSINATDYANMLNFNYVDLIKDNIYNAIFNNPNFYKNLDFSASTIFLRNEMNLLKEINASLYDKILSTHFNKEQFDNIESADFKNQIENFYSTKDAFEAYLSAISLVNKEYMPALIQKYMDIYTELSSYRTSDIDWRYVSFLYIKYSNDKTFYIPLSDSDKLMVNKYLYDQCIELIKTFNGMHYMFDIVDLSENLTQLQNINDISIDYFDRLQKVYLILACSRNIDTLFNTDISNLNAKQISDIIISDLPKFYLAIADTQDLDRDFGWRGLIYTLAKVTYWGKTGAKDNLTNLYNMYSYYREQFSIFYKLEYNFYHFLPNDVELLNNFTYWNLRRALWGNDGWLRFQNTYAPAEEDPMDNMIYGAHKAYAITHLAERGDIPDIFKSYLEKYPDRKGDIIHNIFPLLAYNQFIKLNVSQLNISFIDLFLEVLSNYFNINEEYDDEYYKNITGPMPDKDTVLQGESQINPAGNKFFKNIDVSNFKRRLELFEETCPVGYYILMDSFYKDYNYTLIGDSLWKYDNTHREFYIMNRQGNNVTYYEFCNLIINQMKHIMDSLGVVSGNKIIFKNVNLTFSRLLDMENPYNNIFNKYPYFHMFYEKDYDQIEEEEEDFYRNSIKDELKHDLIYLKNINQTLYDSIMNKCFDEAESFDYWYNDHRDLAFDDLLFKYYSICEMLKGYRDENKLAENEINVIINQLTNDTIQYLSAETEQKVRSHLLYYIFFWELYHNKDTSEFAFNHPNPKVGTLPVDLLDKPLADIYKRYTEILNHVTFHIFDEDIDFTSLSINDMRNVLINNLYRAYNAPNRFQIVFDFLNERGIHFDNFLGYENYINSNAAKDELIDLYESIRKIVVPSRENVNPNPNQEQVNPNPNPNQGQVNPNPNVQRPFSLDDLNKMIDIILDEHSYPDDYHIYDDVNDPECYFIGAWNKFAEDYPEISSLVNNDLFKGNMNQFIRNNGNNYGTVRNLIVQYLQNLYDNVPAENPNPNQGQVNPNPEVPQIQIDQDIFDDIVNVMENEEIPEPNNIYNDPDDPLNYIMGSWATLKDKYPNLFSYIEKNGFGKEFFNYAAEHKDTARQDVIEIARMILNGEPINKNPEQVNPKGGIISDDDFNEIRKILLDESVYPKKVHYVISDSLTRLYGSWDLIEEKYPEIALNVRNGLFKSYDDLFLYAFFTGDSSVGYRDVRQKIIEYIEKNCYNSEYIAIDDDSLKINGKDVSDCTVDEVYTYLVNQILIRDWNDEDYGNLGQTLLNYADSTYAAYIQFRDLMARTGASESTYKTNIDQFKNKFLDMLKTLNSESSHIDKTILKEIEKIIYNESLIYNGPSIIDNPDKGFLSLLGSWQTFETRYPQIAGIVLESEFGDNLLNMYNKYEAMGAQGVRDRIIEFVNKIDPKLYPNIGIESSSNQKPNAYLPIVDNFYIPQHNVAGTSVDDIIGFMNEAVEQANAHVERIRPRDEPLANSLRTQIDKLYTDYLGYVKSYNHQYQYIMFIQSLNELFKGLNPANYIDPNAQLKSFIIKKDSTDNFNRQKFIESMDKSLKFANDFADEVAKTNKILADRLRNSANALYKTAMDKVNNGGDRKFYYEEFVNSLNKLFLDHIDANTVHERKENAAISKMTNEQILAKITAFMSQPLSYPKNIKDRYKEIKNLKDPDRGDLVDLYNDVNNMFLTLKSNTIRLDALKGKYTFFDSVNYPMNLNLNEYKKQMERELYQIKESLPNLHYSIKKSYVIDIKNINSLEELKVLRQKLNDFCNNYLQFHKIDKKWYNDLSKEFGERNAFSNILKTYFDITDPELGFTKNLSLASANTIKDYINKEMEWLRENNRDLYTYYLADLFDDAKSMDSYFEKLEKGVPAEQMDAVYQNLYRNIQQRIQPVRNLIHTISLYYYDSAKSNAYIKSITDALNIKFNEKTGGFTKVLINAIRNINSYTIKYNLTKILIESGINPIDGSIKYETKEKIKTEILKMFSINREIKDEEFEFLVDIMDFNLNSKMRSLLLADYVKIINKYYNKDDKQHEYFCEYQRIRFEVLRYQALTVQKIQLYDEELAILNNLESLKCYKDLNDFLELKLKYNNFKNIANFAVKDAVKNSIEYTIMTKGLQADIANLQHVNDYYGVFNKKNSLPDDFNAMVNMIQNDMETIQNSDFVLFSEIRDKFFEGYNKIGDYLYSKYDNNNVSALKNLYNNIYNYLGNWRNNQLVSTIELLSQG